MKFPGLAKRLGRHHPEYQPQSDRSGADPMERVADRALPLYTPSDDPRGDSIAEHVATVPGMRGVA